jgi:hypothetical protein
MAVAMLAVTSCAAGSNMDQGEESAGSGDQVSFVIDNDLVPASSVTVYVVPESGGRQRLGSIPGSGRQTFRFRPTARTMQFRIRAEVNGGNDVQTESFNLVGISRIEWSTSRQDVRLIR